MAERKRKLKFSDSEIQVLTDDVQRALVKSARTTSHCMREESRLGWHMSAVGVFKYPPTDCKRWCQDIKRTKETRPT